MAIKEWRGDRRRFLALGAMGAAGAALACTGGGSSQLAPTPTTPPTPRTAATPDPSTPRLSTRHGGTLRTTGYVVSDGVHDPHRTQSPPFVGQQSMVFSRLLAYASQTKGEITTDLAGNMPERPDARTYVFKLNPRARWDSRAPTNGRAVTADDVVTSLLRQRDGDASFVRKVSWSVLERVEAAAPDTISITAAQPLATLTHLFADLASFVIPAELANSDFGLSNQLGSGPFRLVEWNEGRFTSSARSPAWHGEDRQPYLDGLSLVQPVDAGQVEGDLRTKKLDVAFVGAGVARRLRRVLPELVEVTAGQAQFFGMRFFLPQFPFNDLRFRSAVSYAIDRQAMVQRFFEGSGQASPWISWPITHWALPEVDLQQLPGYRPGTAGRAQDIAEARALLAAFSNEREVPAELPLIVVDETERALGMGSIMAEQLRENLGLNVKVVAEPLPTIIQRLFRKDGPWVAGPDTGWVDLDDWVFPYFHREGTRNTFALIDDQLDALIDAQRVDLNEATRRETGYAIQRRLLALNPGINLVSERVTALAWPYVRDFPIDAVDGYQHRFAGTWLDRSSASFKGR